MSPTLWAAWALTSLVVALAGPFGTFDTQPFAWRLVYWSGLIAIAIVIAITCRTLWRHILAGRPQWIEDIAVAASLSVIFGPFVILLNRIVGGIEAYQAMGLPAVVAFTFVISIGIIALRYAIAGSHLPRGAQVASSDRLLERIKAAPDARLARISSDNHHIRIITNDGAEHRLLMRLSDAVNETDTATGVCVHRSHWVARDAVVGVKKVAGRDVVELACGTQLPVGPKYAANLDFARQINA